MRGKSTIGSWPKIWTTGSRKGCKDLRVNLMGNCELTLLSTIILHIQHSDYLACWLFPHLFITRALQLISLLLFLYRYSPLFPLSHLLLYLPNSLCGPNYHVHITTVSHALIWWFPYIKVCRFFYSISVCQQPLSVALFEIGSPPPYVPTQ